MKILHITSSLDGGGIARLLHDYCIKMMPDIEFDFAITSETVGMLEDEFINRGCKVYHIPQVRKGIIKHCRALEKIMIEGNYDIIHDHGDYKSLFSLIVAKKVGIKNRIVHSHLAFVPESFMKTIERRVITELVVMLSTHLMACSEDAAKWMWGDRRFSANKVTLMTNAINTIDFKYDVETRRKLREELGLSDNFVIGNVARFSYQKNHEFLLEIFSSISASDSNAKLLLIGDGELKNSIVKKAHELNIFEKIIFLGTINNVADYLNVMDVFVLPSRFEGLGIVYVEAQANGLHCFATDGVVPNEANVCDLIEYIQKDYSAEQWAKCILESSHDRMKDPSQMIKENGYDLDNAINKIKRFYLSLR